MVVIIILSYHKKLARSMDGAHKFSMRLRKGSDRHILQVPYSSAVLVHFAQDYGGMSLGMVQNRAMIARIKVHRSDDSISRSQIWLRLYIISDQSVISFNIL